MTPDSQVRHRSGERARLQYLRSSPDRSSCREALIAAYAQQLEREGLHPEHAALRARRAYEVQQ